MLLHPYNLPPPFFSKTLDSSSPLLFSLPTLSHQNPKPPKFSIRSSSTTDTQNVSNSAIKRISEKLRSLGFIEEDEQSSNQNLQPKTGHGSAGEIFLPFSHQFPKNRVGHTIDSSWSTPENPVPEPGSGNAITRFHKLKSEVEKQKGLVKKEERVPTLAELTIPAEELRRLRGIGIGLKKKLNVGKAGITEGIVNGIHERWRRVEIVKIRCEDLCKMNMKRTHDLLERKTGGLVIWRSGSNIILYRGANYKYPYFLTDNDRTNNSSDDELSSESRVAYKVESGKDINLVCEDGVKSGLPSSFNRMTRLALVNGVGSPNKVRFQLPGEAQLTEEADGMLDGLGPRFTDWWGYDPVPVDADLLPAVVPGYRRPFRLLPYGVKPKLTDDEMTTLRRLGRPLPCHFALGRNRNLQGLATSMVKLWEKCEIAKIAVKRGVQNTNSEMMAEELKRLTGGTLISRDREFIAFYRGKDFLPPAVSMAIEERRKSGVNREKQWSEQRLSIDTVPELELRTNGPAPVDGFPEKNDRNKWKLVPEQRKFRSKDLAIKRISTKLSMALEKKEKAEKILAELEKVAEPQQPIVDREGITEEERYMLKKVGLKMKAYVPLGRRGVFDGTVENMHLHWKYRELVKLIVSDRSIENVYAAARTLETESGGILVAVERVNRAYAIIMYRGKNYQRPVDLRPRTLLNKRQAMKLSIEAQRRESLKLHVLRLTKNIDQMKRQLVKDDTEMNLLQSTEHKRLNTKFETSDQPSLVEYSHNQENTGSVASDNDQEATKGRGNDSTPFYSNYCMDASSYSKATVQSDKLINSFSQYEESNQMQLKASSEPVLKETHSDIFLDEAGGRDDDDSASLPLNSLSQDAAEAFISANELVEPSIELDNKKFESPIHRDEVEKSSNMEVPFRALPLSNRDRLVLRKQALKMKKRPVIAVGRNNVVTGVAKTIKTHFQKNPLAIVNVKGRAKGTSIQEVIFKLEQATGAVLVSQEPNKVILYRGWLEGEEPNGVKDQRKAKKASTGREASAREMVSRQLIEAIRLECGLQSNQEEGTL